MNKRIDDNIVPITPLTWKPATSLIKVVGVGGGGCNAVTYMYNQEVKGCDMIVCNTDSQSLAKSNVPHKIQLGEGLGAGTNPTKGRNAALDSQDNIEKMILGGNTQMLFITAGMGGGTGTGASPVIAKMAKEKGILTVAVVTMPFKNEGDDFHAKALDGIHELRNYVDSLLIINNEKLYDYFGDLLIHQAFPKVDEVLATAVKGIVEIINKPGYVNVDFEDVKTMMKDSGLALMGCGTGSGKNRLEDATKMALESPLLNDYDLKTAKNLLLNITVGKNDQSVSMREFEDLSKLISEYTGSVNKYKRGIIFEEDPDFGDKINITAIATGFRMNLTDFTGRQKCKLIMIDENFTYEDYKENLKKMKEEEKNGEDTKPNEIKLVSEKIEVVKLGRGSGENVRKFHFEEGEKPCLCVEPGENIATLEQVAALQRSSKQML